MSHFEKILIPFLDKNMYKIDFTSSAGFVDAYEDDEDNPMIIEIYILCTI